MVKIFIVEDDRLLQDLYSLIFRETGYEIIGKAFDGEEAILTYKRLVEKPDIIILDYRMPLKNGIEVMKAIKLLKVNQKFIFASADTTIKEQTLELGALGFVEKPFEIRTFLKLLEIILNEE